MEKELAYTIFLYLPFVFLYSVSYLLGAAPAAAIAAAAITKLARPIR